ncbi:GNAT family N-acetyltransferase [Jiella sp. MQZ9-1]|uniref:GNAT family N-acetyltransferase n=2 Tax=Jiella flava TaxID=2816857 RepID=A0A939FUN4_9HYPH|nr:GNAT family N-acetyltransferase [Jiella flava]MCD2469757.1 GNAT family N-acetyltransferase [Jiella flava]
MMPRSSCCRIRPAVDDDADALFDICLKTADAGADASALFGDPRLPGYIWSVPYLKLAPEFAYVLADGLRTIGYVLAVADTARFEDELEKTWWPQVRRAVADLPPRRPNDAQALERIAAPRRSPQWLLTDYPAHLHINILPIRQSSGWGRKMVNKTLDALSSAHVPGVHVGLHPLNERARSFYSHLGFENVSRDGHILYARRLPGHEGKAG